MAKSNLLTASLWFYGKIDTEEVPSKVQLVMFHLIKLFNSNHWAPLKSISINKLHANANISERTAKSALDEIFQRGWLINTRNGYVLNTVEPITEKNTAATEDVITGKLYEGEEKDERTYPVGGGAGLEGRNLPENVLELFNRGIRAPAGFSSGVQLARNDEKVRS